MQSFSEFEYLGLAWARAGLIHPWPDSTRRFIVIARGENRRALSPGTLRDAEIEILLGQTENQAIVVAGADEDGVNTIADHRLKRSAVILGAGDNAGMQESVPQVA